MLVCIDWRLMLEAGTAIATIALAGLTFATLLEIKRQRHNAYKPWLIISNDVFKAQGEIKDGIGMPVRWLNDTTRPDTIPYDPYSYRTNIYYLVCHNIGFGAAKNAIARFSYDIDSIIDEINQAAKKIENNYKLEIKKEGNLIEIVNIDSKLPIGGYAISRDNGLEINLGNPLPTSEISAANLLPIPTLYITLVNILVYYTFKDKQTSFEFPILKVKISYQDIANKKHNPKFLIKPQLEMNSGSGYYTGRIVIES